MKYKLFLFCFAVSALLAECVYILPEKPTFANFDEMKRLSNEPAIMMWIRSLTTSKIFIKWASFTQKLFLYLRNL